MIEEAILPKTPSRHSTARREVTRFTSRRTQAGRMQQRAERRFHVCSKALLNAWVSLFPGTDKIEDIL
jgi:hypothetical protein